jgi:hypothetical protein
VVDHALAADFGGVRCEHGDNQALPEQFAYLFGADAFGLQPLDSLCQRDTAFLQIGLPVLGQIGEERKEHEATDKGDGIVKVECLQPGVDRPPYTAMPVHAGRADIFGLAEQLLTAISADDIAQHLSKEADIRVLLNRLGRCTVHGPQDCCCAAMPSSDIAMQEDQPRRLASSTNIAVCASTPCCTFS